MLDHLQTEALNPASTHLDQLTPLELVHLMNREDGLAVRAVATQAEAVAQAIDAIADRLAKGGRLIYVGAGTSGRLGVLDATECPPTFNSPAGQVVGLIAGGQKALTQAVEGAEDHPEYAEQDLDALSLDNRDVVVGIATSGRTPYVRGAVTHARKRGVYTIGLSCNMQSDLSGEVDLAITPVVGPEILSGSTRLKAGTATKLVLNMLTTGAMVRLGKTYGNLMVDLRVTNTKLRARTNRIVRLVTGLTEAEADRLLESCQGELKTALVAQQARVSPEEARSRLARAGGRVRAALEGPWKENARPTGGELYLGIDGGGSHTVALLASASYAPASSSWSLLGRGETGPSNLQAVGTLQTLAALDEAVSRAFAASKLKRCPVAGVCLGLAGAGRPEDQQRIHDWARRIPLADHIQVTTDVALLLAAGTPEQWGLALVSGTGSIAYGRSPDGHCHRAGGWGSLLGDEGSGYALAVAGLRAVMRETDGRGPETSLTTRFLERFHLTEPQQLVPVVYQGNLDRTELAALAPLVLDAAARGDSVAMQIVGEEVRQLAQAGATVARNLGLLSAPVPLALAGGVLLTSAYYRQRLLQELQSLGISGSPATMVTEPAEGAVLLALKAMPKVPERPGAPTAFGRR
jgi:N-acetylmuramic acid 6-phosphate etherase